MGRPARAPLWVAALAWAALGDATASAHPARPPPANGTAYDSPGETSHPLWDFQWRLVPKAEVLACSVALFFSGILCSAAGVGGGGVYVAVLMVAGKLSPHNAVPLSKAIVLFGSVASLLVNVHKWRLPNGCVIDLDACRVVVPAALVGTFLGVLLNWHVRDLFIVGLLAFMLAVMAALVMRTAWEQRCEELEAEQKRGGAATAAAAAPPPPREGALPEGPLAPNPQDDAGQDAGSASASTPLCHGSPCGDLERVPLLPQSDRAHSHTPTGPDVFISLWLLTVVVLSGVLRFHMKACQDEKLSNRGSASCRHPVVMTLFGGRMELWMSDHATAMALQCMAMSLPIWSCCVIAAYYAHLVCLRAKWSLTRVATYQATAVATGLLAGLVGIGGGLILSPFFLLAGMDPAVAVGTSSTCVLFTSASTTMQYAFTDRIITSLAVVYGVVALVASSSGTSLVHLIRDWFPFRKSYISLLVALTVALSVALVLVKLIGLMQASAPTGDHGVAAEGAVLQQLVSAL